MTIRTRQQWLEPDNDDGQDTMMTNRAQQQARRIARVTMMSRPCWSPTSTPGPPYLCTGRGYSSLGIPTMQGKGVVPTLSRAQGLEDEDEVAETEYKEVKGGVGLPR